MTKLLYMDNCNLLESSSKIIYVDIDEKGKYFYTPETIIYPQGGGQPCDYALCTTNKGEIEVYFSKIIDGQVRHYYNANFSLDKDDNIKIQVDHKRRMLNRRYHSAGHLIGDIVLKLYNIHAIKGHQFPNESYIETNLPLEISSEKLESHINNTIDQNLSVKCYKIEKNEYNNQFRNVPYYIPDDKIFRVCEIDGFVPVPCGGIHVDNLKMIEHIKITKIINKGDKAKISYILL